MSIPEGFKLVPVEPTDEMLGAVWSVINSNGGYGTKACYEAMLDAAPTPPQPIYDEAKERELFEEFYSERAKTLPLSLGNKPVRYAGGQYVNDFALFGWMVWLECAKSRAKSVEVGDE